MDAASWLPPDGYRWDICCVLYILFNSLPGFDEILRVT